MQGAPNFSKSLKARKSAPEQNIVYLPERELAKMTGNKYREGLSCRIPYSEGEERT